MWQHFEEQEQMRPVQLIFLVILSILFSVLFANVAKIISTDAGLFQHQVTDENSIGKKNYDDASYVNHQGIDDSFKELMWFIQVGSFIHINVAFNSVVV